MDLALHTVPLVMQISNESDLDSEGSRATTHYDILGRHDLCCACRQKMKRRVFVKFFAAPTTPWCPLGVPGGSFLGENNAFSAPRAFFLWCVSGASVVPQWGGGCTDAPRGPFFR